MSKLFLLFFAFGFLNVSAFAHIKDSDPLWFVGKGAEIRLLKPINIPPYQSLVTLVGVKHSVGASAELVLTPGQERDGCRIVLADEMMFDREMSERTMTIQSVVRGPEDHSPDGGVYTIINVDDPTVERIECYKHVIRLRRGSTSVRAMNIKEFKAAGAGLLELRMPAPIIF